MKGKRTGDSEAALCTAGAVRQLEEAGRRGLTLVLHTTTIHTHCHTHTLSHTLCLADTVSQTHISSITIMTCETLRMNSSKL